MKRVLFVGDSPATPSGFARGSRAILEGLDHRYGGRFDCHVLGINHLGDPLPPGHLYPVYPCGPGGDGFGIGRLEWALKRVRPDLLVIQNDPWNFGLYFEALDQADGGRFARTPIMAVVAIDGENCKAAATLNRAALTVFWTEFAREQARMGGHSGASAVVPLGVDLEAFRPMDRLEARAALGVLDYVGDAFIVGNVNRNQPRKRWDLTIRYFAKWAKAPGAPPKARLFLNAAPTGDTGVDVMDLARRYGIADRIMLHEPPMHEGVGEERLRATYAAFDVQVTTTQGEGWGLTTLEGMACGIPQVLPLWSALGEWAAPAAWGVPCTSTAIGPPWGFGNVVGGVADEGLFVEALREMQVPATRRAIGAMGLALASERRFRWAEISARYAELAEQAVEIGAARAEAAAREAEERAAAGRGAVA